MRTRDNHTDMMATVTRRPGILPLFIALAVAGTVTACSSSTAPPVGGGSGAGKHVDAATAGTVTGRVTFEGTPPEPDKLKMGADPTCAAAAGPAPKSDAVLITDGAIQNVFVYVKEGLDPSYTFDVPTKALEFDQRGCRYLPRVFGVRTGQPIDIINDDETMHNVHALPKTNQEFNQSLQTKGQRMTRTFTAPEVMVRFKCDVHNWMTAQVGVMEHPFFAVTKADGTFDIRGIPPGTYTIEAWHEKLGTQTQQITIGDKQAQAASFVFTAKS